MNSLVLYESQFGNTRHIAQMIAKRLEARGPVRIAAIGDYKPEFLDGVDLVFVGGPTQAHGMTLPMRKFVDRLESRPDGIPAAAFDTRVKGPGFLWGSAAREIAVRLARNGFRVVAEPESFHVTLGKEPALYPAEETHATRWADGVAATLQPAAGVGV